jgi:hypothetical protein
MRRDKQAGQDGTNGTVGHVPSGTNGTHTFRCVPCPVEVSRPDGLSLANLSRQMKRDGCPANARVCVTNC